MFGKEDVDRFYYSSENLVNGVKQMHRMKQCLAKNYRGHLGPMNGFYEETMHFYLQAIEEGGIRQHWEQQQRDKDDVKRRLVDGEVTITFEHMKRVLNLLFVGYTAAAVSFGVELIVGRVRRGS
jgi:hypothetical protein